YHELVTEATRFWRTGGVGIETGAGGIKIRAGSIETMLFGGVSFGLPEGVYPGHPVADNHRFDLFPDKRSIEINPYQHALYYLMLYPGTVRGLEVGAPVDFRGTRVGNVERVSFGLLSEEQLNSISDVAFPVPILIRIEPARLMGFDTQEQLDLARVGLAEAVVAGMRATIRQGNLITGDHYVSLEPLGESGESEVFTLGEYQVMPSATSGVARLSESAVAVFDKLQKLPLEDSVQQLNGSLETLQRLLWRTDRVLAGVSEDSPLYQDMQQTLTRVRGTLQNVDQLARTLKNRPSELIFSSTPESDPIPRKER
ncbi:MAG: MlaD family protein, partial [Granulosicoccaceae bacterium]